MEVHGSFIWRLKEAPDGIVDLSGAKVGQLLDDRDSYAKDQLLVIDNFGYDSFDLPLGRDREPGRAMDTKQRLSWLRSQKQFSPEPYEQAIRVLRKLGHEREARLIAQAKQHDLRKRGTLDMGARIWNWFLEVTTGHGYKPWLALLWIMAFIIFGWGVFNLNKRDFIPTKEGVYLRPEYIQDRKVPKGYPALNTLLYSADVFLPIVNLQQKDYWMPHKRSVAGWLYLPIHIVLGCFFTAVLVAGVSGLIRKD
jgi:hypothetical protein